MGWSDLFCLLVVWCLSKPLLIIFVTLQWVLQTAHLFFIFRNRSECMSLYIWHTLKSQSHLFAKQLLFLLNTHKCHSIACLSGSGGRRMGWCLWMHSLIYRAYMYHGLVNVAAVGDIWDGVCGCTVWSIGLHVSWTCQCGSGGRHIGWCLWMHSLIYTCIKDLSMSR